MEFEACIQLMQCMSVYYVIDQCNEKEAQYEEVNWFKFHFFRIRPKLLPVQQLWARFVRGPLLPRADQGGRSRWAPQVRVRLPAALPRGHRGQEALLQEDLPERLVCSYAWTCDCGCCFRVVSKSWVVSRWICWTFLRSLKATFGSWKRHKICQKWPI